MRELNDTPPPTPEVGAALRSARRAVIYDTFIELAGALIWIGVVLVANRLAFGTWVPVWWLAVLAGVVLPDVGRAALDLAAITAGRMTYTVELCDGSTVESREMW
ncbi:hypothetical protein [Amycolatopsis sp. CA-126428]|uniref:hypothetical protein n=1 Tax=Amycolatopsis sp. CA-126428 TaxID=2073158 RepID=UPI000CD2018E|nr:hypothetical protein [Amycolatopsis sp. CA-126428]